MSLLLARFNKLERSVPPQEKRRRVICVVAASGDKIGAHKLLEAEGYDPANGDLGIIEFIVTPAGQSPYSEPPHIA